MDVEFTADMEKELDSVEEGELNWKKLINDFYPSFKDTLEKAQKNIEKFRLKTKNRMSYVKSAEEKWCTS